MIVLKNVSKYYYNKGIIASGFTKVNLNLDLGEFVAITGESGSGKSTLLNVISGLDSYDDGEMYIDGKETSHYTEVDYEKYRRKYISNIFQDFNLVNSYTVKQNIELSLLFNGEHGKDMNERVLNLIKEVGLSRYKNTKVSKLSGGQKQRVAIARALAKDTPIIIADEPTGNLDVKSAKGIFELLNKISKDKLVVVVTHNYEQVEPYVTRKIKMHDGRILEDKTIRTQNKLRYVDNYSVKNITWFNKIRLGFRNAFNIVPKFLLVLLVYLFICFAVIFVNAYSRKLVYDTNSYGANDYFTDTRDTRLVIKKNDKSVFTDEDYSLISNMEHVDNVVKNDLLVDSLVYITDEKNFFYNATVKSLSELDDVVSVGALPSKDNEIVVAGSKNSGFIANLEEKLIGMEVFLNTDNSVGLGEKYKIVGIYYSDDIEDDYISNGFIYGTDKMISNLQYSINIEYSTFELYFNKSYHNDDSGSMLYKIVPNSNVSRGGAYITDDLNQDCDRFNCLNEVINIKISNLYYEKKLDVKVVKTYNRDNINQLLGIKDYDTYNGAIFVNVDDYKSLFVSGNYQSSVYVDNVKYVDEVASELKDNNLYVLKMRDCLDNFDVPQVLKIYLSVILVVLIVALFFISYFVITIILKSRNIYYSIIRILGSSKKCCKQLLSIELLTVSNLAYISFLLFLGLNHLGILSIGGIPVKIILEYLTVKDYLILYVVIMLMSYLISIRFSRKIFKNSAMATIREGV